MKKGKGGGGAAPWNGKREAKPVVRSVESTRLMSGRPRKGKGGGKKGRAFAFNKGVCSAISEWCCWDRPLKQGGREKKKISALFPQGEKCSFLVSYSMEKAW